MYLFFDTETTGKPKRYNAPASEVDNWPRITQLAAILYDAEGKEMLSLSSLIKPDGWEIPKEKFFIDHNMSTERSEQFGKPIMDVLNPFVFMIEQCEYIIAHNLDFDLPVTQAEMIRYKVRAQKKPQRFCTMKSEEVIAFCNLPGQYGSKWPKLEELHTILFMETFDGAHDALVDVRATARCFFELKRRGVITV